MLNRLYYLANPGRFRRRIVLLTRLNDADRVVRPQPRNPAPSLELSEDLRSNRRRSNGAAYDHGFHQNLLLRTISPHEIEAGPLAGCSKWGVRH
ncbi:hypothetical protein LshimejAT787_0506360 [Lyophyllum shimeji]|uniref:Uncharacterized protein n=1 Tax=Lyophyllum shimeji TaxID=47721 RepID=A0A9P3UQ07_LYOSH|nr:hypothetical protein LshimejAT787_0506360 [Lyophyllum shimeji]